MDTGENNINAENSSNSNMTNKEDVVIQELQKESASKENQDPNIVQDVPLDLSMKKPTKRGRRISNVIAPRRNPKRQTQLNKQSSKLFDNESWVEKRAEKAKKAKAAKERAAAKKAVRYSARVQGKCGAVYSPPSPLIRKHLRTWPTEGMLERPEYDPKTGKIELMDFLTRSIAENYNERKKSEIEGEMKDPTKADSSQNSSEREGIDVISHVVLHRVITFAASALQFQKREREAYEKEQKIEYFNYLGLEKNQKDDDEKDELNNLGFEKNVSDITYNLKELLKDTMIKYCIANAINQTDLAKYIDSLTPEDITNISKEQNPDGNEATGSS